MLCSHHITFPQSPIRSLIIIYLMLKWAGPGIVVNTRYHQRDNLSDMGWCRHKVDNLTACSIKVLKNTNYLPFSMGIFSVKSLQIFFDTPHYYCFPFRKVQERKSFLKIFSDGVEESSRGGKAPFLLFSFLLRLSILFFFFFFSFFFSFFSSFFFFFFFC